MAITLDTEVITERRGEWQLRRWCPIAGTHQDVEDVDCNWEHDIGVYGYVPWAHRLRKRRMIVCSECAQGYFNQEKFDEHGCYSAY